VFFRFPGNNSVNHVGLIEAVEPGGTLICIEGSTAGTAAGDQRNGGMVARKRRLANIVGFARPAYAATQASSAAAPAASPKDLDMLDNIPVRGAGSIRRILPVGRASAVLARAWVSLVADGPAGAKAHVYFQHDGGGIDDKKISTIYRDGCRPGRGSRPWTEPRRSTSSTTHPTAP
jgi:hypothetical protein